MKIKYIAFENSLYFLIFVRSYCIKYAIYQFTLLMLLDLKLQNHPRYYCDACLLTAGGTEPH